MDRKTILIVVVIVALLGLGGAILLRSKSKAPTTTTPTTTNQEATNDTSNTENTTGETSTNVSVEIKDFAFAPGTLTVPKGTTVVWTNKDSVGHTVTPDDVSDAFEGSEMIAKDETYQFTFDTPGTYTYHCQPHPQMKATVVVTE